MERLYHFGRLFVAHSVHDTRRISVYRGVEVSHDVGAAGHDRDVVGDRDG